MSLVSPALWFFVVCGAVAGWLVGDLVPAGLREPFLHPQDFHLARKDGQPAEITEARWMFLPFPCAADFDLRMEVELGEGADLDVLVRLVEPRVVGGGLLPFPGRFAVLRLTTGKEGKGWRSRDEALAGERGGGVGLAPGIGASVWIEGRGRQLTANVAGKPQGTFTADDEYGMFALLVRGGNAVVRSLDVVAKGQPMAWLWSRWTWAAGGAIGTLLLALLAWRLGAHTPWFVTTALPLPLMAYCMARRADLDLAFPAPQAMAAVLGGCFLFVVARLCRSTGPMVGLALAAAVSLGLADRQLRHDNRAVDALFGPDAGSQISEAMGQLVREPDVETANGLVRGPLLDVGQPGKRVFLLGGNQLYQRTTPAEHVALLLRRELRASTRLPVLTPCLPTEDGHSLQQVQLFRRFYTGHRPSVLVFGVPHDEMAILPISGERRSSPAQLQLALAEARAWCDGNGCRLVLFADAGLPEELLVVMREAAAAGLPLVQASDGGAPIDLARQLAAAITPLLAP